MKTRIEKNALGALASAALLMVLTGCGSSVVPIKSSTASTSGAGTTSNTGGGSTYVPIVTPTSTPTPTVTPTVTPTPTASTTPTATTTPATPWANAHIAEGDGHSCLIDTAGGVWCWGHNTSGQLGNNTTTDAKTVVRVSNLGSGVKAIAAGGAHSCALTSTGAVYCWGANESGELGNGTKTNSSIPVAVSGLTSGALAIAVGYQHSCAISRTYALYCWGSNNYGQLGIGSLTDSTTPKAVSGFSTGAIGLALGYHHSCATDVQGALKCWGYNDSGRLGDGTTTNRTVPTQVVGLTSGVVTLAVGYIHTCAVDSVGTLSCWGSNYYGQLGAGTSTSGAYYTPVAITTVSIAVQGVSLGGYHTCITDGNAGLQCWGYNAFGQLGDSTKTNSALPVTTNNINGPIRGLAVGGYHSCALDASGIQCWGNNQYGQLGDGTLTHQSTPVSVYSVTPPQ